MHKKAVNYENLRFCLSLLVYCTIIIIVVSAILKATEAVEEESIRRHKNNC